MKKTLIALAVAASAVISGSTMAALGGWSEGTNGGSVNVGGTITIDKTPVWLVATGTGFSGFSNVDADLTGDDKLLTVNAPEAIPVLAIKSKEAYTASDYSKGTMPSIVVSGGNGVAISRTNWSNARFDFSAPIYVDGAIAGTATFVQAAPAGLMYGTNVNRTSGIGLVVSDNVDVATSLYAGAVGGSQQAGDITTTEAIMTSLGFSDLITETKDKVGSFSSWSDHGWMQSLTPATAITCFNTESMSKAATAFAFGIEQNGTIKLAFNNAIQSTTEWTVPINVAVTYN
ncbi:hypothetical protein [Escherichia coli]|uniref:F4 family fimbrial subunit n=1 Tax=Escherichia coli TaxID=562 RepID=UPI000BE503E5|nr:hypothetical protein [Escherichia coli]